MTVEKTIIGVLEYEIAQHPENSLDAVAIRDSLNEAIEWVKRQGFPKRKNKGKYPFELYVYDINDNGFAQFIGPIVDATPDDFYIEVISAIMATCAGMWELTGEIKRLPRSKCRVFDDSTACLESALQLNRRLSGR